jgi:O-antigen ligase
MRTLRPWRACSIASAIAWGLVLAVSWRRSRSPQRLGRGLPRGGVLFMLGPAACDAGPRGGNTPSRRRVTDRVYSMFDLKDPSNRDRLAMMQAGTAMVKDHPLTGVGPDMVTVLYPQYRVASAVNEHAPHLHNVPMQIAAERGLPALGLWFWFIGVTAWDLVRRMRTSADPSIAAAGLAALVSMCAAGMFEYNFGDSEFLILLLVLVTLPFAADHPAPERTA